MGTGEYADKTRIGARPPVEVTADAASTAGTSLKSAPAAPFCIVSLRPESKTMAKRRRLPPAP